MMLQVVNSDSKLFIHIGLIYFQRLHLYAICIGDYLCIDYVYSYVL